MICSRCNQKRENQLNIFFPFGINEFVDIYSIIVNASFNCVFINSFHGYVEGNRKNL